jgi:peptide/nickel transport system substrate-binding protein
VSLAGRDPDPYPLWHSSQIQGGNNFAAWNNPEVDRLLHEARQPDPSYPDEVARRTKLYSEFQDLFAREQPAIPLFYPVYAYAVSDPNVGGIQLPQLLVASTRFATLPNWYVHTERILATGDRTPRPTP